MNKTVVHNIVILFVVHNVVHNIELKPVIPVSIHNAKLWPFIIHSDVYNTNLWPFKAIMNDKRLKFGIMNEIANDLSFITRFPLYEQSLESSFAKNRLKQVPGFKIRNFNKNYSL